MTYTPPPEYAQYGEVFTVALSEGYRIVVRLGYYNHRLADFMVQLEALHAVAWHPVARIDCCGGSVHRHQFIRSTGEDVLDHKVWAVLPERDREAVDRLIGEGYDWGYDFMLDRWEELVRRWRNG